MVVAGYVVAARRTSAPWARAFRASLILGAVVIVVRLAFEVVFGTDRRPDGPRRPARGAACRTGRPASASAAASPCEGLRRRAARRRPDRHDDRLRRRGQRAGQPQPPAQGGARRALRGRASSVVVALTLAPQAVEDVQRLRRARRLRGRSDRGLAGLGSVALPALEGSLRALAAARRLDGRARLRPPRRRRPPAATYSRRRSSSAGSWAWSSASTASSTPGSPACSACRSCSPVGALAAVRASRSRAGAASARRYRPDPWRGARVGHRARGRRTRRRAGRRSAAGEPGRSLDPSSPLAWPSLPLLPGARDPRGAAPRLGHAAAGSARRRPAQRPRPTPDRDRSRTAAEVAA